VRPARDGRYSPLWGTISFFFTSIISELGRGKKKVENGLALFFLTLFSVEENKSRKTRKTSAARTEDEVNTRKKPRLVHRGLMTAIIL
jgi:hypothetical protein